MPENNKSNSFYEAVGKVVAAALVAMILVLLVTGFWKLLVWLAHLHV